MEEDEDIEAAWLSELEQRVHEVMSDSVDLEDWATVRQRIEARLRRGSRD
jgi:hypothetical protein